MLYRDDEDIDEEPVEIGRYAQALPEFEPADVQEWQVVHNALAVENDGEVAQFTIDVHITRIKLTDP
jgi:hypothetical protein